MDVGPHDERPNTLCDRQTDGDKLMNLGIEYNRWVVEVAAAYSFVWYHALYATIKLYARCKSAKSIQCSKMHVVIVVMTVMQ